MGGSGGATIFPGGAAGAGGNTGRYAVKRITVRVTDEVAVWLAETASDSRSQFAARIVAALFQMRDSAHIRPLINRLV